MSFVIGDVVSLRQGAIIAFKMTRAMARKSRGEHIERTFFTFWPNRLSSCKGNISRMQHICEIAKPRPSWASTICHMTCYEAKAPSSHQKWMPNTWWVCAFRVLFVEILATTAFFITKTDHHVVKVRTACLILESCGNSNQIHVEYA